MTKDAQKQAEQFVDDVSMVSKFDQGQRPIAAMTREDMVEALGYSAIASDSYRSRARPPRRASSRGGPQLNNAVLA